MTSEHVRAETHTDTEGNEYFINFDSPHLPDITWQEMFERQEVIAPKTLVSALKDAEGFLSTEPGPNLEKRKYLAREWFSYWNRTLRRQVRHSKQGYEVGVAPAKGKLMPFEEINSYLQERPFKQASSGITFASGMEGHAGHIHFVSEAKKNSSIFVLALDDISHIKGKKRGGLFLPREVVISMWVFHKDVDVVTVLPPRKEEVSENDHYDQLFFQAGVQTFYYDTYDKNAHLKTMRNISKGISPYWGLDPDELLPPETSTLKLMPDDDWETKGMIRHLNVADTTSRVKHLFDPEFDWDLDSAFYSICYGLRTTDTMFEA